MDAKLKDVPPKWLRGKTRNVVVGIVNGTAGRQCTVTLFRTTPGPEQLIGSEQTNLDDNGADDVSFLVTLGDPGINVLHCEVTTSNDFDSDSKGTLVE